MSEEKLQKVEGQEQLAPEPGGEETFDITLNRATNELKFKDPTTGRVITFKATDEIEKPSVEQREKEPSKPLTPNEFREALEKVDALGLGWTADIQSHIRAKTPEHEGIFLSPEFLEIQKNYPHLPREVGAVTFHVLTGSKALESVVGGEDDLQQKVAAVRQFVITADYRSEFFFKHAIKVPYLSDIDWEVVFKLGEKNVKGIPGIPYALLSLLFHNPSSTAARGRVPETKTVAVNEFLVGRLIDALTEVKRALEDSRQLADLVDSRSESDEDDDDARTAPEPKQLV